MAAPLLAVVGFDQEAMRITRPGLIVVTGGGDKDGLRGKLQAVLSKGRVRAVVSLGIGGALAPEITVGDWCLADRIVEGGNVWSVDPVLLQALRRELGAATGGATVHVGTIAASDAILTDARSKAALHARTRALAVDMESHVAARFAAERRLPFIALRVISDGAFDALPPAVLVSMKPDGGLDGWAILLSILKSPGQIPALSRTGRNTKIAFRRLELLGRHDLLGRLGIGDTDLGQLPLDVV